MINSPWLTIEQAGEYCHVSRRTIEAWLRDGLRHAKVDRTVGIRPEWMDEYLETFSELSNADALVREISAELRQ